MNEHEQERISPEDQPLEAAQPVPSDQPPVEAEPTSDDTPPVVVPPSKINLALQFAVGFLGWYFIASILYGQMSGEETVIICGGMLFPANVVLLLLLLKFQRFMGWGMLSALGVNLVISLILGLSTNAFCFIPFFAEP